MKVISYSIFRAPCEKFEFMAYLRGLYFNVRMNRLIYPDWKTIINFGPDLDTESKEFLYALHERFDIFLFLNRGTDYLCEKMLWRMAPMFGELLDYKGMPFTITHLLCRDADAITTYREAQLVNVWLKTADSVHAILDNPAHDGLMGGMIGFKTNSIKSIFGSWSEMIQGYDLSKRGSDQNLLNQRLLPKVKKTVMFSVATGNSGTSWPKVPNVDPKLWESNLTCRHIGSAGVVEMETIRFFKRFDKTDYSEFEKEHSDILYWAR